MSKAREAQEIVNAVVGRIISPGFAKLLGRDIEPEILFRLRCEPELFEKCQEVLGVQTQHLLKSKKVEL